MRDKYMRSIVSLSITRILINLLFLGAGLFEYVYIEGIVSKCGNKLCHESEQEGQQSSFKIINRSTFRYSEVYEISK